MQPKRSTYKTPSSNNSLKQRPANSRSLTLSNLLKASSSAHPPRASSRCRRTPSQQLSPPSLPSFYRKAPSGTATAWSPSVAPSGARAPGRFPGMCKCLCSGFHPASCAQSTSRRSGRQSAASSSSSRQRLSSRSAASQKTALQVAHVRTRASSSQACKATILHAFA